MDCLTSFSNSSGLKVNLSKSLIFCSPNVNIGFKRVIRDKVQVLFATSLCSYLSIPMLNERISKNTFNAIIDKMRKNLPLGRPVPSTWQERKS